MGRPTDFEVNDIAIVTKELRRADWRSKLLPGERVKITAVWHGENYTVVDILPCNGSLPMGDICCDSTGPLRKERT